MLPRVRNVPRTVSPNVPTIRDRFQTFSIPRRSWTITECRNAVPISHGRSATFSTGSHAQYPPHPRTLYDHRAPSTKPIVRKIQAVIVHRRVTRIHASLTRPVINAAIANANGTVNPMNPRYRNGGCAAISGWFCSNGSGPRPSSGAVARVANGVVGPSTRTR